MNNYIDISKQQRVVFVDNIPYNDAKALSEAYPFAIIMTDTNKPQDYSENGGHHTIWRGGKCYSYISSVDNSAITIDTYSISLNLSSAGKLSLNIGSAIDNFELSNYFRLDNTVFSYDEIIDTNYNTSDNIIQYTQPIEIKNKGELYFKLFGKQGEELSEYNETDKNLFTFRLLSGEEDILDSKISYPKSKKVTDNNFAGIKYVFDVKEECLDSNLILEVSYKLLGQTKTKRYPIILRKTLENELVWIGSGEPSYLDDGTNYDITNNDVNTNNGWYYLDNINIPIQIDNGNIWVIIPSNKYLRVNIQSDTETTCIIDEGNTNETYSYEIIRNCIINNNTYKILRLKDTNITEFINIIK